MLTRDIYYVSNQKSEIWTIEYFPGKNQIGMNGPVADFTEFNFSTDKIGINLRTEYISYISMGPLWFAIIPMFGATIDEENTYLYIRVGINRKDPGILIDPSKWLVQINDESKEFQGKVIFEDINYFKIKYPIKHPSIDKMTIKFGGFTKNGVEIPIPDLEMKKKRGSFRYWVF